MTWGNDHSLTRCSGMSNEQRVRVGTETEEFARLLRRLKDRSGRSYGVLAGQLHMSVSTLHRYCNGDAVPMDFAPADRLARRCGATSDELVELHRRWILADEARRRSRAAGSSGGTSPGSAASSAPTPSPASTEPSAPASSSTDEPPASSPDKPATSSTGKPAASPTEPTDTTPDPAPDLPSTPPSADEAPGEDAPEVPTDPVAVRRTPARRTYLRIALALSAVASPHSRRRALHRAVARRTGSPPPGERRGTARPATRGPTAPARAGPRRTTVTREERRRTWASARTTGSSPVASTSSSRSLRTVSRRRPHHRTPVAGHVPRAVSTVAICGSSSPQRAARTPPLC